MRTWAVLECLLPFPPYPTITIIIIICTVIVADLFFAKMYPLQYYYHFFLSVGLTIWQVLTARLHVVVVVVKVTYDGGCIFPLWFSQSTITAFAIFIVIIYIDTGNGGSSASVPTTLPRESARKV